MVVDVALMWRGGVGGRVRAALALLALVLAPALGGCSTPEPREPTPPTGTTPTSTPPPPGRITLVSVLTGLDSPVLVLEVPDGSGRLVVVEQAGVVQLEGDAAMDLRDRVGSGGERGLLGFAFHPGYAENGATFASYTDLDGDSVLARYLGFDAASEEVLLRVDQPFANHNGGHIAFGPDGMLYWGLGDGGAAGDPQGNGQDKDALLGSILRIDAGPAGEARAPADNPYVDAEGADLVWAKGLRNPWRFSFDRATGDLWIGDVGQNAEEEIDHQPASSRGGENYGWNAWEGRSRYSPIARTFSTPVAPVATYPTDEGCAVTGGFVYRGPSAPSLMGTYLFADYCNGDIRGIDQFEGEWRVRDVLETELRVSSFGEDADGDVYVVDHGGAVYRIVER